MRDNFEVENAQILNNENSSHKKRIQKIIEIKKYEKVMNVRYRQSKLNILNFDQMEN